MRGDSGFSPGTGSEEARSGNMLMHNEGGACGFNVERERTGVRVTS